jgi:hypothetical protein
MSEYIRISIAISNRFYSIHNAHAIILKDNFTSLNDNDIIDFMILELQKNEHGIFELYDPVTKLSDNSNIDSVNEMVVYGTKSYDWDTKSYENVQKNQTYRVYVMTRDDGPTQYQLHENITNLVISSPMDNLFLEYDSTTKEVYGQIVLNTVNVNYTIILTDTPSLSINGVKKLFNTSTLFTIVSTEPHNVSGINTIIKAFDKHVITVDEYIGNFYAYVYLKNNTNQDEYIESIQFST